MLRPLTLALFVLSLLSAPAWAQESTAPPVTAPAVSAPVLAEVDGLRLENGLLKVQQATLALDKLKADLQALITSLQKPGYQITQGPDGKLVYTPVPSTTATPETTPPASGAP